MSAHEVCLTCGTVGSVEAHHVAGRVNFPDLVVPVCLGCHLILTNWQHAAGMNLEPGERVDADRFRALLVGCLHLVQLIADRHADTDRLGLSARLADHLARVCSKVLDEDEDRGREGRWLPDPAWFVSTVTPLGFDESTEHQRAADLLGLVVFLAETLGGLPVVTLRRLREMAVRPDDFTD